MNYVKAYLSALFEIAGFLGLIFIVGGTLFNDNVAKIIMYFSFSAALAGPIKVWINKSENN